MMVFEEGIMIVSEPGVAASSDANRHHHNAFKQR